MQGDVLEEAHGKRHQLQRSNQLLCQGAEMAARCGPFCSDGPSAAGARCGDLDLKRLAILHNTCTFRLGFSHFVLPGVQQRSFLFFSSTRAFPQVRGIMWPGQLFRSDHFV